MNCGAPCRSAHEDVRYDAVGLPIVTLAGVEVWRCATCGARAMLVLAVEELHGVLNRSRPAGHRYAYQPERGWTKEA